MKKMYFLTFALQADTILIFQKDVDDFFERERNHLVEYHLHIKETHQKGEKMIRFRKSEILFFTF